MAYIKMRDQQISGKISANVHDIQVSNLNM